MSVGLLQVDVPASLARTRLLTPARQLFLACLCVVWFIPGIMGRGLWKPVETDLVPIINESMITQWSWIPTRLGDPELAIHPLYITVAAAAGRQLAPSLELPEAMRWSNLLWLVGGFFLTGYAVWHHGSRVVWRTVLLMMGSLGLLLHARTVNPDVTLIAIGAAGIIGVYQVQRNRLIGGLILGLTGSIGFLCVGPLAVWYILFLLLLPLALRRYRLLSPLNSASVIAVMITAVAVVGWLWLLDMYEAGLALSYLQEQLAALAPVVIVQTTQDFLLTASWFTWPALPFAAMAYVRWHHQPDGKDDIPIGLLSLVAGSLAYICAGDRGDSSAILLLPAAAIMAAVSMTGLSKEVAKMLDRFAVLVIGFGIIGFLWFTWIAAQLGSPADVIAWLGQWGVEPEPPGSYVLLALLATVVWIALMLRIGRSTERAVLNWVVGVTMGWLVFVLLWLPAVDRVKSYTSLATSLAEHVGDKDACITYADISDNLAAQLAFLSQLRFVAQGSGDNCTWLFERQTPNGNRPAAWTGNRPVRGAQESYALYDLSS